MKSLIVIPARYASTRFPGKPLALLDGMPIIEHVWERLCLMRGCDCMVATDDERIADAVEGFEGKVMMTSASHRSGTDRCGEVLERMERTEGTEYDVVVNVQGDEPFVEPAQVQALIRCFDDPQVQVATLRTRITSLDELLSANNVKVLTDNRGNALYFSRAPLPYLRDVPQSQWLGHAPFYKHVGIYAFRPAMLRRLCALPEGELERLERLEQLRWLQAGCPIRVADTTHANIGIDTPDDLHAAEEYINTHKI